MSSQAEKHVLGNQTRKRTTKKTAILLNRRVPKRHTMIASRPCADRVLVPGIPPALFTSTSRRGFEAKKEPANVSTWVK